jgi:hypothetical protein
MQIRLLLRVTLPQPVFDQAAALALINYQQRHKQAAYRSHRARRLLRAHRAFAPAPIPRPGRLASALARPRDDHVSL